MIVDIELIKKALYLPSTVSNEIINYAINHHYNIIMDKTNSTVTATNNGVSILSDNEVISYTPTQEISDDSLYADADKLTNLQKTLIASIGCEFINLKISTQQPSTALTNLYLKVLDTTKLTLNTDGTSYIVTWCNIYDYLLNNLITTTDNDSPEAYIRQLFNLDENLISDSEITFLYKHYYNVVINEVNDENLDTTSSKILIHL